MKTRPQNKGMKQTKPGELRSFAAYPRCSADVVGYRWTRLPGLRWSMRDPEAIVTSGYYRGLRRRAARASTSLAGLALLGALGAAAMVSRGYWVEAQYNRGFGQVSVCDSRSRVAEVMGGAGQESKCAADGGEGVAQCTTAVTYMATPSFEAWTFGFNADGRLVSKVHEDLD